MSNKNPYAFLKTDCLGDVEAHEPQHSWTLTDSRREQITIHTASLPGGEWVYGYAVSWHNGRFSSALPSAERGLFRSERDARLYAVGFMLGFLEYFTGETCDALKRAQAELAQNDLF